MSELTDDRRELANIIERYLEHNGWNRTTLAGKLGYSKSAVSQWLNGKAPIPFTAVEAMCTLLNVNGQDAERIILLAGYQMSNFTAGQARNKLTKMFNADLQIRTLRHSDVTLHQVEQLLNDVFENRWLRVLTLQAYLADGHHNETVLSRMLQDPDWEVRRAVVKELRNSPSAGIAPIVGPETMIRLMNDESKDVAVEAVTTVCHFVRLGRYETWILTKVGLHEYWKVQELALQQLVRLEQPENITLLAYFHSAASHTCQGLIRNFITHHHGQRSFTLSQVHTARTLLENMNRAHRVTTKQKEENERLLIILKKHYSDS